MTTSDVTNPTLGRRNVLRLLGCAALSGAAATSSAATASAQESTDLDAWFEKTSNYDGVADKTGASEVTVTVGSQANGGAFGFGPAAIRIDPGTKVVWEWTGEGGVHDVTAEDGSFGSDLVGDAGHTFEHTFDADGVYKYVCSPHAAMGMKGAVVVGDATVGGASTSQPTDSEAQPESSDDTADPTDLDTWLENTSNYDGVVDKTGLSRVEVTVGSEANSGAFGFGPAAVRVTKGTTVVWRWTGAGGSHNVVHTDGAFESELVGDEGHTFEHTFDETGTFPYSCVPHESMGMKGAVVVASEEASGSHAQIAEPFDDPETAKLGGLALAGVFGTAMALPALSGVVSWLTEQSGGDGGN
ncbi:halocyanin domain-containing protein (plasmid) [Haloferax sp. S1W]|uniref:halocyanin domain-containing protein n=1 Tax=Haloferax sp. S1W TaxID=3377110 RepID=UPI0037C83B87